MNFDCVANRGSRFSRASQNSITGRTSTVPLLAMGIFRATAIASSRFFVSMRKYRPAVRASLQTDRRSRAVCHVCGEPHRRSPAVHCPALCRLGWRTVSNRITREYRSHQIKVACPLFLPHTLVDKAAFTNLERLFPMSYSDIAKGIQSIGTPGPAIIQ